MNCPLCLAVPPHILSAIIAHPATDAPTRSRALRTLTQTSQLGGQRRMAAGMLNNSALRNPVAVNRFVYSSGNTTRVPGTLVRREGQAAQNDAAVDEAFDGAGAVYNFLRTVFRRNSLDNRGLMLASTVHYGRDFDNAAWDGGEMLYGDGDGYFFNRFTSCIDIIGHELFHGFTQYTSGLEYEGQPGWINEHISDTFGIMLKQWLLGQTAETASWLIGEGLLTPNVQGSALRSFKAPGTAYNDPIIGNDPQPATWDEIDHDNPDDNGGVHINSGPLNHAFYLA